MFLQKNIFVINFDFFMVTFILNWWTTSFFIRTRIQNKIRDCLIKFKPDKEKCGMKTPVLAAVYNNNDISSLIDSDNFYVEKWNDRNRERSIKRQWKQQMA